MPGASPHIPDAAPKPRGHDQAMPAVTHPKPVCEGGKQEDGREDHKEGAHRVAEKSVCEGGGEREQVGKGPGWVELIPGQSGCQPGDPAQPRASLKVLLLDSGPQSSAEGQAHAQPGSYLLN